MKIPNKGKATAHVTGEKTQTWTDSEGNSKSAKVPVIELRDQSGGKVGNLVGNQIHREGQKPQRVSIPKGFKPK